MIPYVVEPIFKLFGKAMSHIKFERADKHLTQKGTLNQNSVWGEMLTGISMFQIPMIQYASKLLIISFVHALVSLS